MVPLARNIQGCADRNGRWSLKWRNSLRRWNSGDRLALDLYVWIKRRTSSNQAHCHFRSLQEGSEKTERVSFRSYLQQRPRARDEREAEVINCCGRWDKLFWTVKNTLPWTERLLTMLRDFFFFYFWWGWEGWWLKTTSWEPWKNRRQSEYSDLKGRRPPQQGNKLGRWGEVGRRETSRKSAWSVRGLRSPWIY